MLIRDLVASDPGADGVNRNTAPVRDILGSASGLDDLSMGFHAPVMHNALRECKRLLHNGTRYANRMDDPAARLRTARLRAGFTTGKEAAESMGIAVQTYLSHENGSRGIKPGMATRYAKKFKVSEQWLLYGTGDAPGTEGDIKAEVTSIIDHLPPLRRAEALGYLRALASINEK
jgi:transcriptional regulator with XRE-family HTH domain